MSTNVNLAFKEVPVVDVAQHRQFISNRVRITQLTGDVQNPTFYRNRNLLITAFFILSMAVFVPTIRSLVLSSPSSSFSVVHLTLGISSVAWGPFSYICLYRNKLRDEKEMNDLTTKNKSLQQTVQVCIEECEANMKTCDVALCQDQLADGRLLNQRDNSLYQVAAWTVTPWHALETIVDQGNSRAVLAGVRDLDEQTAFLQSQQAAITQFRQANEAAKSKLEALKCQCEILSMMRIV